MPPSKRSKIMILTASIGGGHVAAAKAIYSGFLELYNDRYDVELYDIFSDPRLRLAVPLDKVAIPLYSSGSRSLNSYPYKLFYDFASVTTGLINRFATTVSRNKGRAFLKQTNPDVIVTTFPIISYIVNRIYQDMGQARPALISLVTDSGDVHKLWYSQVDDAILVSTPDTIDYAEAEGVERQRLHYLGFPIDKRYNQLPDKLEARQLLGLRPDLPVFLLTGGGLGLSKNLLNLAQRISRTPLAAQFVFVAGRNQGLLRSLQDTNFVNPAVVLGFSDDMPALVAAADAVIGKAGWISLYEAMVAGRPTMVIDVIKGQEEANAEFLARHEVGEICLKPERAFERLTSWIENPAQLEVYRRNLERLDIEPDARRKIPQFVVDSFVSPRHNKH